MAVRKDNRFGSAAEFRKAFEALNIHCDWKLRRKRRVVSYVTQITDAAFKVTIRPSKKNRFDIVTTKKAGQGKERQVAKDCIPSLTLAQMKKKIRQILPRYVSKGR